MILHDLEVSRRVNVVLGSEIKKLDEAVDHSERSDCNQFPVDYLIVSDNYWPPLTDKGGSNFEFGGAEEEEESFKHHPVIKSKIKQYCDVFEDLKKPRKLKPVAELGQADLELTFDDGSTRTFTVSPVQATLILLVSESEGAAVTSVELAALVGREEAEVRRWMGYWVSKSVIAAEFDATIVSSGTA